MKHRGIVIVGLLIAFSLIATPAYAQGGTTTEENLGTIFDGFKTLAFWVALLATLIAGAVGGVVYELLILQGNIELPHKLTEEEMTTAENAPRYAIGKYMYDLGIWARLIIGALAAVAAFLVVAPDTAFKLVATAVVAGSAGSSIFSSMQDRLSATLAQKAAADARAVADKMNAKVEEASQAFAELKETLVMASTSPAGERGLVFPSDAAPLELGDLDRVERLLSEAQGIHQGIG